MPSHRPALAYRFVAAGEQVVISNSRGPQSLRDLAASIGPALTTVAESAKEEIVVLAVPWRRLSEAVAAADVLDWQERIVIDTTNPLGPPDFKVADLDGRTSSEVVAELVPGSTAGEGVQDPDAGGAGSDPRQNFVGRRLLSFSANHPGANERVTRLADRVGWAVIRSGPAGVRRTAAAVPGRPPADAQLLSSWSPDPRRIVRT